MPVETEPSTRTSYSMEEYLRTAYHPDCDFVDGRIEERNMGETTHGLLQAELAFWFRLHKTEWGIRVISELRTRVGSDRVRIPDIAVVLNDAALQEQVRVTPPLLAIEILSPEDRLPRVTKRLHDFLIMGVENIWLLNPQKRTAFIYTESGLQRADGPRLAVPNSPIYLDIPEVFSALD